jgi:sulfite oxidase
VTGWGKRADMVVHEVEPYNAEPPLHGLAGEQVTAVESFYSRNHGPVPRLEPTAWRLTVDGLVDRELELSLRELKDRFELRTLTATLQCAGNRRAGFLAVRDIPGEDPWRGGATSTASWTGVLLGDVLAAARLRDTAAHVEFTAPDVSELADPPQPYAGSVPVGKAVSGAVLLAWEMNGQPLPAVHGGPVRVVVPGWIGARSVKWVQRITARTTPSDGYFQATAYRLLPADTDPATVGPGVGLSLGPVGLNTEILRPPAGASVPAGPTEVTGYSFAGDGRGVARVEVSADGGRTWVQAEVYDQDGPWAWQLWRADVDLGAGPVTLTARAWDTGGTAQPADAEHLWNPKGYFNNSWAQADITADQPCRETALLPSAPRVPRIQAG